MKKTTLLFLLITSLSWGQTKKIFHKSHSGKAGTMFMDMSNSYGQGMAPVRYQTPESSIKLNYLISGKYRYPLVTLDTAAKTMRFFDLKDSLIGCDRDYREYLHHGAIVYDIVSKEFWVYQYYNTKVNTQLFLTISDSIQVWEQKKRYIRHSSSFIRDGNNARIIMSYPILDYTLTRQLVQPVSPKKSFPIITENDLEKSERRVEKEIKKKQRKSDRKAKKKESELDPETDEIQNEFIPVLSIPSSPNSTIIRWVVFALLGFSIFIFMGVKRIVNEEVSKLKD